MRLIESLGHTLRHPYALLPGAPTGIINSAREWTAEALRRTPADLRRGPPAAVWEIDPPALRAIPSPASTEGACSEVPALLTTSPTALFMLKGARILGRDGVVISPDNRVFAEFTYVDEPGGIARHSVFRRRRFPKPQPLAGVYATLCYPSSSAYFHWIVESLPRLRMVRPYLDALDGVFVPEHLEPAMKESLLVMGLREDQLVPLGMQSHYAPSTLLVPSYCAGLNMPDWVPAFLRSAVMPAREPWARRRVYISRADAGKRRVVNEADLEPLLAARGFEIVRLRELGFCAQASLFDSAEFVVGAHGAGLANTVFCRPGSHVVELLPSPNVGPHVFHALATAAGCHYHALAGIAQRTSPEQQEVHCDFSMSPARLAGRLDEIGCGARVAKVAHA